MPRASQRYSANKISPNCSLTGDRGFYEFAKTPRGHANGRNCGFNSLKLIFLLAVWSLILLVSASTGFSQKVNREKPIECKSNLAVHGEFKTAFVGSSRAGGLFSVDIIVLPKNQTDENYVAIAKQLKAKYCKENYIAVNMYDNRKHLELGGIPQPERPIDGYPRALYLIKRTAGEEALEVYKIVNGKIETRVLKMN